VAADFGLVAHAAERDADERTPRRIGDRLAERSLAHAGRTDEAEDAAARVTGELEHGHVLEDALLDVVEPEVIFLELLRHGGKIVLHVGLGAPRQIGDPLEVRADDVVLRLLGAQAGEPGELAVGHGARLFREPRLVETRLERAEVAFVLAVAELAVDGFELLAQERLALALADLLPHVRFDLLLDLGHGLGLRQELGHEAQPRRDTELGEDGHLALGVHAEGRRHLVGEHAGLCRGKRDLGERAAPLGDELLHVLAERIGEEPSFGVVRARFLDGLAVREPERAVVGEVVERHPAQALEREPVLAAARTRDLGHANVRAHVVKLGPPWVDDLRVALGDDADHVAGLERFDESDRALAADRKGDDGTGKEHARAERKKGKGIPRRAGAAA
jgi:hypothetical protein